MRAPANRLMLPTGAKLGRCGSTRATAPRTVRPEARGLAVSFCIVLSFFNYLSIIYYLVARRYPIARRHPVARRRTGLAPTKFRGRRKCGRPNGSRQTGRSEEHTSEL